jgi:hypothetical protein
LLINDLFLFIGDSFLFGNGLATVVSDFMISFYPEIKLQADPTSKNKTETEAKPLS